MNQVATIEGSALPAMIEHAAQMLAEAKTSAEILVARHLADEVYSEAKRTARVSQKAAAHADVIARAHRAQADALLIISKADAQIADEYGAAQERGEVEKHGGNRLGTKITDDNLALPTLKDLGLSANQVFAARQIRDAEAAQPGIVARALDEKLAKGEEPTKSALRKIVIEEARKGLQDRGPTPAKNPLYRKPTAAGAAWTHLYAECRALNEWATAENIKLARSGMRERSDDQFRNIGAIRACAAMLNKIVGDMFDA